MTDMGLSDMGMCELADYEDIMLSPYLDSGGVKTVGIGSTISDISDLPSWPWDKKITIEEALAIYKKGLSKYITAVNKALLVNVIKQHQFDALVSIAYNIGVGAMAKSTFMKRINAGEDPERISEAMRRYNMDNGKVVQGLVNRRKYEAGVFLHGAYKSNGCADLIQVNSRTHKPMYSTSKRINLITHKDTPQVQVVDRGDDMPLEVNNKSMVWRFIDVLMKGINKNK